MVSSLCDIFNTSKENYENFNNIRDLYGTKEYRYRKILINGKSQAEFGCGTCSITKEDCITFPSCVFRRKDDNCKTLRTVTEENFLQCYSKRDSNNKKDEDGATELCRLNNRMCFLTINDDEGLLAVG
uniref:Uncharacterized protein n=1 Tax=Meloidogyne incognita TaxID=6306 RepID=A0A914L899_MELIC